MNKSCAHVTLYKYLTTVSKFDSGTAVLFFLFFFKDFSFDDPGQDVNRHWGVDCAFVLFFAYFVLNSFFAVYLMILVKMSMGTGKMMVLLFSADMLLSV